MKRRIIATPVSTTGRPNASNGIDTAMTVEAFCVPCTDNAANFFPDVPDSDVGCKYIYFIWSRNIVDGFADGTYGPGLPVTREQMSKFLVNTYKLTISGP